MTEVSLFKLLLFSLSMLGVVRLLVVVFLGDDQAGPAIYRIMWRRNASWGNDAEKRKNAGERSRPVH
jgi:hypothetical protein